MESVFNDLAMIPCTSDGDHFYCNNIDIFDWEEAKRNVNVSLFCISSCDNFLIMNDITGMFSDRTMNSVASQLGTKDFYIVPVSIDKIIFVKKAEYSYSAIESTFQRIRADVPEHQRISADIYEYDFDGKTPKISEQREAEQTHEVHEDVASEQESEVRIERQSLQPDAQTGYGMQERENSVEEPDNEEHDADYFAEYDTYDPAEFARTMVDLFNFRLGHNFHLSGNGMQLTDSNNFVSLDMNEANTEYQNNSMDFLEYGDFLVDRFKGLEVEANKVEESLDEEDSYPDDCLPF